MNRSLTGRNLGTPHVRSMALAWWLGCAVCLLAVPVAEAGKPKAPAATLPVWPPPPETARVRFVTELRSAGDLGVTGSMLGRAARRLAGTKSKGAIQLVRPTDVWSTDSSRLFISDASASALYLFDRPTRSARQVGTSGPGTLGKPMGLGGDETGRLLVADAGNRRIVVFDNEGRYLKAFGGRGVLLNPVDVAADPRSGRIWVVDAYLHQVVVFDSSGAVWKRIGRTDALAESTDAMWRTDVPGHEPGGLARGARDARENRGNAPGEFLYPASITRAPSGRFFVTDGLNGRVQSFGPEGDHVATFGSIGDTPGSLPRPKGIACDSQGHLYVVDAAFNNVQVFDEQGALMLSVGGLGQEAGRFWLPLGIHIDRNDYIYVADRYNGRVQVLQYLKHTAAAVSGPGAAREMTPAPEKEGGRP